MANNNVSSVAIDAANEAIKNVKTVIFGVCMLSMIAGFGGGSWIKTNLRSLQLTSEALERGFMHVTEDGDYAWVSQAPNDTVALRKARPGEEIDLDLHERMKTTDELITGLTNSGNWLESRANNGNEAHSNVVTSLKVLDRTKLADLTDGELSRLVRLMKVSENVRIADEAWARCLSQFDLNGTGYDEEYDDKIELAADAVVNMWHDQFQQSSRSALRHSFKVAQLLGGIEEHSAHVSIEEPLVEESLDGEIALDDTSKVSTEAEEQ